MATPVCLGPLAPGWSHKDALSLCIPSPTQGMQAMPTGNQTGKAYWGEIPRLSSKDTILGILLGQVDQPAKSITVLTIESVAGWKELEPPGPCMQQIL